MGECHLLGVRALLETARARNAAQIESGGRTTSQIPAFLILSFSTSPSPEMQPGVFRGFFSAHLEASAGAVNHSRSHHSSDKEDRPTLEVGSAAEGAGA